MTDLYARNGFIVRHRELAAGVSELEVKLPMHSRQDALVSALALVYLALVRRGVPLVASSATLLSYAVRTVDLDEATRQAIAEAVALLQRDVTRLLADAEIYFFGKKDKGLLETDPDGVLTHYRQAEVIGRGFLERFAAG